MTKDLRNVESGSSQHRKLNSALTAIRNAGNALSILGAGVLLIMMLLGACDVIGRYLFNSPIKGAMEISRILMGGTVFFAWAHTHYRRGHVTVDIFFVLYPPRVRAALTFFMLLLTFVFFALIMWQSTAVAISNWQSGKLVQIILIPLAPFKLMVPLGALLMCFESMAQMIEIWLNDFRAEEH